MTDLRAERPSSSDYTEFTEAGDPSAPHHVHAPQTTLLYAVCTAQLYGRWRHRRCRIPLECGDWGGTEAPGHPAVDSPTSELPSELRSQCLIFYVGCLAMSIF